MKLKRSLVVLMMLVLGVVMAAPASNASPVCIWELRRYATVCLP